MKKIPKGAEASNILVGELNILDKPLSAFIRLSEAVILGDLTEVPVPTRFIFILLGPSVSVSPMLCLLGVTRAAPAMSFTKTEPKDFEPSKFQPFDPSFSAFEPLNFEAFEPMSFLASESFSLQGL